MRGIPAVLWFMLVFPLLAFTAPVQKCELCHAKSGFHKVLPDKQIISLYVPPDSLAGSVHHQRQCTDCHRDATEIPHKENLQRVDCTTCHYIGNLVGAPETAKYEEYRESVHGRAALSGNTKAPRCQNCHGAHNVRIPRSPESPLSHSNLAKSCGQCHLEVYTRFAASVHGQLLEQGANGVPTCIDCHGEHTIASPDEPSSSVFAANIPNTCSKCHAAESIIAKFGVSTAQVETYEESFHGIATTFGSKKAANCASCHGAHEILPPQDPASWVNPANIPHTCGKCHPEANANWAKGKIHVDASKKEAGVIFYVATFFKWLTLLTLAALAGNILLDLFRRVRGHKKAH